MKRDYRLNTRLNGSEYDRTYKFMQEHRCKSMDAAVRLMIHLCTSYDEEKTVPLRNIPERIM